MKERPILFSGPMVRAILEGRKTQMRRVVKPQAWSYSNDVLGQPQIYARSGPNDFGDPAPICCPYGQPGDLLWVRETWAAGRTFYNFEGLNLHPARYEIIYKADGARIDKSEAKALFDGKDIWHPSIHMPKWAARLWLRITNVRVERLQEIYPWECKAEGIAKELNDVSFDLMEKFRHLWDSLNAKRGYSWESNPYVWVVEFEKV